MKKLFERRMGSYFGGLLLSLAAMLAIFQAKRAFMPQFHEQRVTWPPAGVAPGAIIKIIYKEDPGHNLIPGLPSRLVVSRKQAGSAVPVIRLQYGDLVSQREVVVGQLTEAGEYILESELYVCASPGVADCAKLFWAQEIRVENAEPKKENRIDLDLAEIAQKGLEAASKDPKPDQSRNR